MEPTNSISTTSVSTSKRRIKFSRKRLLKRGALVRPIKTEDWPFLWAAFRKGALDYFIEPIAKKFEFDIKNVGQHEFRMIFALLMGNAEIGILVATTPKGMGPVGMYIGLHDHPHFAPHVAWFPWATDRNRLETVVRFFVDNRHRKVLIFAEEKNTKFWETVARYGLLYGRGYKLHDYFPDGSTARLWQNK